MEVRMCPSCGHVAALDSMQEIVTGMDFVTDEKGTYLKEYTATMCNTCIDSLENQTFS